MRVRCVRKQGESLEVEETPDGTVISVQGVKPIDTATQALEIRLDDAEEDWLLDQLLRARAARGVLV